MKCLRSLVLHAFLSSAYAADFFISPASTGIKSFEAPFYLVHSLPELAFSSIAFHHSSFRSQSPAARSFLDLFPPVMARPARVGDDVSEGAASDVIAMRSDTRHAGMAPPLVWLWIGAGRCRRGENLPRDFCRRLGRTQEWRDLPRHTAILGVVRPRPPVGSKCSSGGFFRRWGESQRMA
jgi:hypothetical protein